MKLQSKLHLQKDMVFYITADILFFPQSLRAPMAALKGHTHASNKPDGSMTWGAFKLKKVHFHAFIDAAYLIVLTFYGFLSITSCVIL